MSGKRLYHILGASELREARTQFLLMSVAFLLALALLGAAIIIFSYHKRIKNLEDNRIMQGFAIGDGVFVSDKKMPDAHVRSFIREWISCAENYNPETIVEAQSCAKEMMDPALIVDNQENFEKLKRDIKQFNVEQIATLKKTKDKSEMISIEPTDQGTFKVKVEIRRTKLTNDEWYEKDVKRETFEIAKVFVSKQYRWGLRVKSFDFEIANVEKRVKQTN